MESHINYKMTNAGRQDNLKAKKKAKLEKFWKTRGREGGAERIQTGIKGFDEMLEGGIPKGRSLLIIGSTGTGKTVFINEFIYRGITKFDENGVFVTFEERPEDIIKNVKNFGWDYDPFIKQNKLTFVDSSPSKEMTKEISPDYDLSPLVTRIKHAVKKIKAKRVVIDSLGSLFLKFSNKGAVREVFYLLADELKGMGVTTLITSEKIYGYDIPRYDVEEYVSDAVVDLNTEIGQNKMIRTIIVRKIRGVGYRSGKVEFEITNDGVEVYPKIPIDVGVAKTEFKVRKKFGISGLDEALGGGIPRGHMLLVAGNTGTGKTTLGMHFLINGFDSGENCVWVALEEPIPQVKKTVLEHGWDFEKYEQQGRLRFVAVSVIDISPDKLLYQILDAVNDIGAGRVVFDSVSSLESATMDKNKVREFLVQLSGFFKTLGVTCIMNYLTAESFSAVKGQLLGSLSATEMRLSSVTDGIIILRFVERGQRVDKLMNIIKMRGSEHSKDILRFEVDRGGFKLCEKFKE